MSEKITLLDALQSMTFFSSLGGFIYLLFY